MCDGFRVVVNSASFEDVYAYLNEMADESTPSLRSVVNLPEYATKLLTRGVVITGISEQHSHPSIVGFLAGYFNDAVSRTAFVSQFHVRRNFRGMGCGMRLMDKAVEIANNLSFKRILLMVNKTNENAVRFYEHYGFVKTGESISQFSMVLNIDQ